MTRTSDDTAKLGCPNNVPSDVYGYAFQRLIDEKIATTLWMNNNIYWSQHIGV